MSRILPPSQRRDRHAPETAFTVVPFVDLPGVSQNPMLFVNHLKSYNHNVSQEVNQTFFLICEDESVRRVVFYCADSPGAVDRAIRKLVPLGTPDGAKVRAVVMFAESWSNDTPEVVARMERGENFNLEGLPGTFDILQIILDAPNVQGMWTNKLVGTIPNRTLGAWEEMKEMRFKRFANYWPESRN
jgi:hypothetical protein